VVAATEPTKAGADGAAAPAATQPETPAAAPAAAPAETVPAPAAAPAPTTAAPTPPTGDQAIAERMRDAANGKYDRIFASKKEPPAVEAWSAPRNSAPLWTTDGAATPRAQAAIAQLKAADAEGLDSSDYPPPDIKAGADPAVLAEAEYRLTASVLAY